MPKRRGFYRRGGVCWRGRLRGCSAHPAYARAFARLGLALTGVLFLLLLLPMWAQAGGGSGSAQAGTGSASSESTPSAAAASTTAIEQSETRRPLSLEERADLYMVRRNFQAVIVLLEPAVKEHPKDAALYNRL